MKEFYRDALRQQRIADANGFFIEDHCFRPVVGANGRIEAHILNFDGVYDLAELRTTSTKKYGDVLKHVEHEIEKLHLLPL